MQGRTHLVIGVSLAVYLMRPTDMHTLVAGAGIAALGSMISDIDAGNSKAMHKAVKIAAFLMIAGVGVLLADLYYGLGIYNELVARGRHVEFVLPLLLFIMLGSIGLLTKHRTFMHSLLAMALFTADMYLMSAEMAWYFAIAFASHLVLDLLNRKGMRLMFPSKSQYAMKLFQSDGIMNQILFIAGIIAIVLIIRDARPVDDLIRMF